MKNYMSSVVSPVWSSINGLIRILNLLRANEVESPVISVGNIVAGGVGKTEIVAQIAERLIQSGLNVTVAMRGYKSYDRKAFFDGAIASDFSQAYQQNFPDEALVLLHKVPDLKLAVGKNRYENLKNNWSFLKPDVVILDDGFQHFGLKRSLDILVHHFGVGDQYFRDFSFWLNVAGLRVSYSEIPNRFKNMPWVKARYVLQGIKSSFNEKPQISKFEAANVVCGIGNPDRFKNFLLENKIEVLNFKPFSDHHHFSKEDLFEIAEWNKQRGSFPILTTLKDYVKIKRILDIIKIDIPLYWVDIAVQLIENEDLFWRKIFESVSISGPISCS